MTSWLAVVAGREMITTIQDRPEGATACSNNQSAPDSFPAAPTKSSHISIHSNKKRSLRMSVIFYFSYFEALSIDYPWILLTIFNARIPEKVTVFTYLPAILPSFQNCFLFSILVNLAASCSSWVIKSSTKLGKIRRVMLQRAVRTSTPALSPLWCS